MVLEEVEMTPRINMGNAIERWTRCSALRAGVASIGPRQRLPVALHATVSKCPNVDPAAPGVAPFQSQAAGHRHHAYARSRSVDSAKDVLAGWPVPTQNDEKPKLLTFSAQFGLLYAYH